MKKHVFSKQKNNFIYISSKRVSMPNSMVLGVWGVTFAQHFAIFGCEYLFVRELLIYYTIVLYNDIATFFLMVLKGDHRVLHILNSSNFAMWGPFVFIFHRDQDLIPIRWFPGCLEECDCLGTLPQSLCKSLCEIDRGTTSSEDWEWGPSIDLT